ncbi:hypothetical protein [Aeromicrobium sp. HA]|uniref:hypothetical protein n=1 Tax=Aeromicrobium sp. HA TaxID=3009077 RepID=UPI0022B078C1|nr:hypothetical protein [Aeromicrobium sp. HA]
MTATLVAASTSATAGDTTEPLPWETPNSPPASTYLELGTVSNPALRDVLAHFSADDEPLLRLSDTIPDAVVLRHAVSRSFNQNIRVFISGSVPVLRPHLQVLRWLATTTGELLQTAENEEWFGSSRNLVDEPAGHHSEAAMPNAAKDVVEVVGWLALQLDVPDGDILRAAKIKRRNWHNWKNGRSPRLETQGQLWALLNSVQALSDMFDNVPGPWFKEGGARRRELLTSGQHRKLVQEALTEAARRGELTNESRRSRRQKSAAGHFE